MAQALRGNFVHSHEKWDIEILEDWVLATDASGTITQFAKYSSDVEVAALKSSGLKELTAVKGDFIIPGFVDCHAHAPQYVNTGRGYDRPLLEWLETYTFPSEAQFADIEVAKQRYGLSTLRHVNDGTTSIALFATIHLEASKALVDILGQRGVRALVGKVNMDRNSPDFLIEETKDSLADTEKFIQYVQSNSSKGLVEACITPRFVPTCTSELMKGLGDLASKYNLAIQSHVSENDGEIAWVQSLHPESANYTSVYAEHGLLTSRTIHGHGVHLDDVQMKAFADSGAAIAHCPPSNFALNSGVASVRKLQKAGVKVGLATDISGGYSTSMLNVMREAIIASKVHYFNDKESLPLTYREALYLATRAGAETLGLPKVGHFAVGMEFDGVVVDLGAANSKVDVVKSDTFEDKVSKFVFVGTGDNIAQVFVRGTQVGPIPVEKFDV